MSENIYDILARLSKDTIVKSEEVDPIYESVDPQDELIESVRILEEKYSKYSYDDEAESKYLNPQAKRFVQLAKAKFPETGSDLEAVVAAIGEKTQELDQRDKETEEWINKARATINQQQQEIEQTEQAVNDANARYDAQEKRFQDFNRQVAAAELDVRQQAQAALDYAKQPEAQPQDVIAQTKGAAPAAPAVEPEEPVQTPTVKPAQTKPISKVTPASNVVDLDAARKAKEAEKAKKEQERLAKQISNLNTQEVPDLDKVVGLQEAEVPRHPLDNWRALRNTANAEIPPVYTNLKFSGTPTPLTLRYIDAIALYNYLLLKSQRNKQTDPQMLANLARTNLNDRKTVEHLLTTSMMKSLKAVLKKQETEKLKAQQTKIDYNAPKQAQPTQQTQQPGLAGTNFGKYIQQKATEPPRQGDLFGNPTMNENVKNIAESLMERFMSFKEAAKPDFLDLDKDGDTEEPMKSAAKSAKDDEPAKPDSDAVAKRKRLQALKDKQEDERAEKGDYDSKSSTRVVKGRAYGGAAQKDDEDKDEVDESGLQAYLGKKKYGKEGMQALQKAGREGASKEKMAIIRAKHDKMDEVAPPGAKAERMVKHIKKGYAKDGKLTKREKGIAYATAWKAKKAGKLEESRNAESSEYTYETVGRVLCDEQPHLDCNSEAFVKAVYDELIEMKLTPKAARWLVHYDEDFLSDCATSYNHFCQSKEKEMAECGSPMNSFVSEEPLLDATQELDEIARLAGLAPKMEAKCSSCGCASCKCDEGLEAMAPSDSASPLTHTCEQCGMTEDKCGCTPKDILVDESAINEAATRKDFRMVADLLKAIPDIAKRTELAIHHADLFKQQNPRFKREMFLAAAGVDTTPIKDESIETEGNAFTGKLAATEKGGEFELDGKKFKDTSDLEEEMSTEGNEFSGALAKAKAAGEKEFEVDGKKYTVKEDINLNVSATGEEDVVNLIRKLSGMPVVVAQAQPAVAEEVVAEEGPKERDVEYTNTPREEVAGTDAAIPSGTDLNRAKKAYSDKPYRGDNPMAVAEAKEESLWKAYESMVNDIKA